MEIPKRFKIANTEYEVQVVDKSDEEITATTMI